MKGLLTNGWLAPVAGKLNGALGKVVAKNDAADRQQTVIRSARERVEVLQKQIAGGTCPTCEQELPPPDETTRQALTEAEFELERLRAEAGDAPDLPLERRIRGLVDATTTNAYKDKQEQLDRLTRTQFERNRRLSSIKDRLKDNDATKIRQLAKQQDTLETAVETFTDHVKGFRIRQDAISNQQNKLANVLRRLGGAQPALQAEALFLRVCENGSNQHNRSVPGEDTGGGRAHCERDVPEADS